MSKLWTSAVVLVVVAGLAFAPSGHRLLYKLGFTSACNTSDCGV